MLKKFVFGIAILLVGIKSSMACMYGKPSPSVCQRYAEADFVIIGEVKKMVTTKKKEFEEYQTVTIDVGRVFKGNYRNQIIVDLEVTQCGFKFYEEESIGKKYLLFLKQNIETKEFWIFNADQIDARNDDLIWLNGLPYSLNRTLISGKIEQHDKNSRMFDFVKYIVGAKVKIFSKKNSYEVFTNEKGRYELWDLPSGKYKIQPEYPLELGLYFSVPYGLVEFKKIDKDRVDTEDFKVEVKKGSCGGADFLVDYVDNLKSNK